MIEFINAASLAITAGATLVATVVIVRRKKPDSDTDQGEEA